MVKSRIRTLGIGHLIILCGLFLVGCKQTSSNVVENIMPIPPSPKIFGFEKNNYTVKNDTVLNGDTFAAILLRNNLSPSKVFQITEKIKDSFDVKKLLIGQPYTILSSKDSIPVAQQFIYQPNLEDYIVVQLTDSVFSFTKKKKVTYIEKIATGEITNSISENINDQGLSPVLTYKLAEDIYAWTIDFNRLQKGDRFKVIYTDKYIDDTIYGGVQNVKAAYFEHKKEPFYAFQFEVDSLKHTMDYFDDKAKTLRYPFLKAPVKFSNITSKYNLNRRIAFYGFKARPHKGTDFAAPVGTPILATANGTVTESKRSGGNGKYVRIRHNKVYETQYLHMQKQNVKVGQYVRQGEVIGWIGMTGNTSGPHVCYRFWVNGEQVDPFKLKLPESNPIAENLKSKYLEFIAPIKERLDSIPYKTTEIKQIDSLQASQ